MSFRDWSIDQVMQHNLRVDRQSRPATAEPSHVEPKGAAAERDMHVEFIEWLRAREIFFIHSRMDRPSTIGVGDPDFVLLHGGKGCAVEFKRPSKRLSQAQAERLAMLQRTGTPAIVAYSVEDAIAFVKSTLIK